MSAPSKEAIDASFDRSLSRFAKAAGVTPEQEESMSTAAPQTSQEEKKTASVHVEVTTLDDGTPAVVVPEGVATVTVKEAASDGPAPPGQGIGGGNQLETGVDRGDYQTQQQAVSDQKNETNQSAKDGTDQRASQVDSADYDDKSYSHGSPVKLSATQAAMKNLIVSLARSPENLEVIAEHLVTAQPYSAGGAAGNLGAPVGGTPEAVEETEEEMDAEAEAAAPPTPDLSQAPPVGDDLTPLDDTVEVRLQDTIRDKQDKADIEQEVLRELKDVLKDVSAMRTKRAEAKEKGEHQSSADKVEEQQGEGTKKENATDFPASREVAQEVKDVGSASSFVGRLANKGKEWWDRLVYQLRQEGYEDEAGMIQHARQGVELDETPGQPGEAVPGFEPGRTHEAPEILAEKKAADTKEPPKDDQSKKVPHASVDPGGYDVSPDPDGALFDESKGQSKGTPDSATGQQFMESSDTDYKLAVSKMAKQISQARRRLAEQVTQKVAAGADEKEAMKEVMASELGQTTVKAMRQLAAIKKESENESPAEMDASGADSNTYSGEEAGYQGDDEISEGTDTTLESPETGKTVDDARKYEDSKHNSDVQGATTASFTANERKKLVAELKGTDEVKEKVKVAFNKIYPQVHYHEVQNRIRKIAEKTVRDLQIAGDELEGVLKTKTADRTDVRRRAAHATIRNRMVREAAVDKMQLMAALATESIYQQARIDRTAPALKLALEMVDKGHISLSNAPSKVKEFLKMGSSEFKTVQKTVGELPPVRGRQRSDGVRTASRLPFFGQEPNAAPADELDGIFEDD